MNEVGGGQPGQSFELLPTGENTENLKAPAETDRPASEASPGKQATPPAAQALPVIPDVPVAAPVADATDDNALQPVASPKTAKIPAKEGDLIEKQWIEKAKEIVAETKNDPYKQKDEMSRAKADYIQKRFKKNVKTDGAPA